MKNENNSKIYFIGAGPGDPELLTLKARRIIQKASIIITAGSLVNKAVLRFAKKQAEFHDSSKMTLKEVLRIIDREKTSRKIIARIHSGDPCLYGAIQEQMNHCEKEKISYEVIPGVSSFQAAAAGLKQELTLPGVSQTVILTRISGKTKVPKKEDLRLLAKIRATMVIFLSVQEIERVVKKLKKGYAKNTPVAVVEKTSWPGERTLIGTLETIAGKVKKADIRRQALIIVGKVLKKEGAFSRLYDETFTHGFRKAQMAKS